MGGVLALFTGTRASELAQVKLDSIRTERDILLLAVEEQTKNRGSQRLIPIHTNLIALGLKIRVQQLRSAGETHLFPTWYLKGMNAKAIANSKESNNTLNHYFPRFIPKRFIHDIRAMGMHDSRKTWHSFRHTFKTGLAHAGVPRTMQDALCGHADNSAGGAYVHGTSIQAMKEAIDKLQFDGFNLGHPTPP